MTCSASHAHLPTTQGWPRGLLIGATTGQRQNRAFALREWLSTEPAFRVEHLPDHPLALVADEPGDQACRVVGFPEPVLREPFEDDVWSAVEVPGVYGTRVDGVQDYPFADEVVRDRPCGSCQCGLG